jgi:hypothetical protein
VTSARTGRRNSINATRLTNSPSSSSPNAEPDDSLARLLDGVPEDDQGEQAARRRGGGEQEHASASGQADRGRQPEARRGRQPLDGGAGVDDRAAAEEADPHDDVRRDPRGVDPRQDSGRVVLEERHVERDQGERGRGERDEQVRP